MKRSLTPSSFRLVLATIFALLIVLGCVIFIFGNQYISKYAADTRELKTQATASDNELQTLSSLKQYLAKNQSAVSKAAQIASTSKSYQYQDQIISDLNSIAGASGVSISSIDFSSNTTSKTATSSSTKKSTTKKAVPNGFKSMTATILLNNPVSYNNLYTFLSKIESNTFQMQISNLTLSSTDSGNVTVSSLTLEVYVR